MLDCGLILMGQCVCGMHVYITCGMESTCVIAYFTLLYTLDVDFTLRLHET